MRYYDAVIREISEDKQVLLEKMMFEKKTLIETMKKRLSKFPRKQIDTDDDFSADDDADYIPSDPSDTDQSLEELREIVDMNKENRRKRSNKSNSDHSKKQKMMSKKKSQQNGNVLSEKTLHKFSNNQMNTGDVDKNNSDEGHVDRDPNDKSSESNGVSAPKKVKSTQQKKPTSTTKGIVSKRNQVSSAKKEAAVLKTERSCTSDEQSKFLIDKYKQRELQAESSFFSQSKAKLYQDKDHKFDNVSLNDKRDAKGKLVQAGENRKAELVQADKMNEQSTYSAMTDEVADKASEQNIDLVQAGEVSINPLRPLSRSSGFH